MANINQQLANIKAAVYGEDVRGSIHDAIEAINEEKMAGVAAAQQSANEAAQSASNANAEYTKAQNAANAAAQSASNSSSSANAASTYLDRADQSAANAATSASNASKSATSASTSEKNASASASTASTKAGEASASAANASASATAASASAQTASTKASEAATSATASSKSADAAGTKATEAGNSATAASKSASTASSKADEASASATSASTSEKSAGAKASAAATSASSASASAQTATTKASEASSSAEIATGKAGEAASSAQTASTKASEAATSASSAADSASAANADMELAKGYAEEAKSYTAEGFAGLVADMGEVKESVSNLETAQEDLSTGLSNAQKSISEITKTQSGLATDVSNLQKDIKNVDAKTVNGHTVESNVPANAKFTDTVTTVENVLTSSSPRNALSAGQGKVLNEMIKMAGTSPVTFITESNQDLNTVKYCKNGYYGLQAGGSIMTSLTNAPDGGDQFIMVVMGLNDSLIGAHVRRFTYINQYSGNCGDTYEQVVKIKSETDESSNTYGAWEKIPTAADIARLDSDLNKRLLNGIGNSVLQKGSDIDNIRYPSSTFSAWVAFNDTNHDEYVAGSNPLNASYVYYGIMLFMKNAQIFIKYPENRAYSRIFANNSWGSWDDYAAPKTHKHTKADITDFPTAMPASDVYGWAKSATKPKYTASEVGAAASGHTHSNYATTGHTHDDRYYTEAEINAKFNSLGLSGFHVLMEDTVASSWIDCFNKKCISARNKGDGVCIIYGGYSGVDYGLFICQVVNRNVIGLYMHSTGLYKVWMSDGTSSCSYVQVTTGNPITS